MNIPKSWPLIVKYLEKYTPLLVTKVVRWNTPSREGFKCNLDCSCKCTIGAICSAFSVRNDIGDFIYMELRLTGEGTVIWMAHVNTIWMAHIIAI